MAETIEMIGGEVLPDMQDVRMHEQIGQPSAIELVFWEKAYRDYPEDEGVKEKLKAAIKAYNADVETGIGV
jgi:hypothetical protein